ncbi:MAG: hypothetical protein ABIH36_01195 [bacterium]
MLNVVLGWGWLAIVVLLLWIAWKVYMLIKSIDYANSIQWTVIQITIPEEAEQTPKAMESAFDVWDGIHKNPDLIEKYFQGYILAWYSCEIHCTKGRARYIMVVPTMHRTFFEGVIYGQYPQAEVREVEDYTLRYHWKDLEKTYDLYGTEVILVKEDYMPIKTYRSYEDTLAEEETFVDPHQALIEAYTNIEEGREFWVQVVAQPIDPKDIEKWEEEGEQEIDKLAGKEAKRKSGLFGVAWQGLLSMPGEVMKAAMEGPQEAGSKGKDSLSFPKVSEADKAKMQGILDKISQGGYSTTVRVIYIAPVGQLHKPDISRAIGAFKQFNTFHLNSLMPNPVSKTNGPNYILKAWRRYMRKRKILLYYQWREPSSTSKGHMMSAEELATLYHFPAKYMRAPAVERAKAGVGSAPENVPYA